MTLPRWRSYPCQTRNLDPYPFGGALLKEKNPQIDAE
jgi:hypothetical protein